MTDSPIFLTATDTELPADIPAGLQRYTGFRDMAIGGGGVLRSARDRMTGRVVAIKTLPESTAHDPSARRRFLREARVTAQLMHPNTVPVYDIGDDPRQGLFFTMKRISGENLFRILVRIARGDAATTAAMPIPRRVEIVADACQALAYAHVRGVIHRDVKPENIWVGNFGEVILLDWGVAKVWGHPDENAAAFLRPTNPPTRDPPTRDSPTRDDRPKSAGSAIGPTVDASSAYDHQSLRTLTGEGTRPGTPLYMSPEQIEGRGTIDPRSDVFSAGACLYEVLAIREAFKGATIDETFDNIRHHTPPTPGQRSPDAGIPPSLDAIVMRAIQKRPADRYQDMRELIRELRTVIENTPTNPPGPPDH